MRRRIFPVLGTALIAPALLMVALGEKPGRGDEPGRLGRFFRSAPTTSNPVSTPPLQELVRSTPPASMSAQPRLVPQPRVSRAITDSDPLLTRISLARADGGAQFGMFLQVYADGTVIDSEGVHQLGREGVRDVLRALESAELYRLKGHCGGPSTDFVEQVQMVVYERSFGRLRSNFFSFSGNTQGCDASVQRLQSALDTLQTKLSRPA